MHDTLQLFEDWYAAYGYPVLFFGVALENAGVPLPGETAVLIAAFLASPAGGERFALAWVIAVAFAAAVCGDNMGYWVGRRLARPRLARGRGFLLLTPERFRKAEGFFDRYGVATVFVARFIAALRVLAAPAAGAAGMHWPTFFLANALGGLTWAVAIGLVGYFFGRSWAAIHHWLGWGAWIVLAVFLLALAVRHLLKRRKGTGPHPAPRP
jgi:membrane protein DedA with SNARE-associated domain